MVAGGGCGRLAFAADFFMARTFWENVFLLKKSREILIPEKCRELLSHTCITSCLGLHYDGCPQNLANLLCAHFAQTSVIRKC